MQSKNIEIDISIDKPPYIKAITNDKIINLTGESGSGKSFYASQFKNRDDYIIVDTDEVFSNNDPEEINKELRELFIKKYNSIDICNDFDMIYSDILNYIGRTDKTIIIDLAQFRNIKDLSLLKGTVIIMRTSIDTCYKRCINRYKEKYPSASKEDIDKYKSRKRHICDWYKSLNEFMYRIGKL